MNSDEIFNKLEPIIRGYLPDDAKDTEITRNSDLTQELNINSAHLIDVILDIEDAFGVEFSNDDLEKLRNLDDVIALIKAKTT